MTACYVYFIGSNKHTKIGVARNPEKRIAELQTGNQYTLEIKATIKMKSEKEAYDLEKFLHKYHARKRKAGEWFLLGNTRLKPSLEAFYSNGGALPVSVEHENIKNRTLARKNLSKKNGKINILLMQRARLAKLLELNGIAFDEILVSDDTSVSKIRKG